MSLVKCPECGSADKVQPYSHPSSYHCRVFFGVACNSQECRDKFWPQERFTPSTGIRDTPEEAEAAWNKGDVETKKWVIRGGGTWTGD